MVVNIKADSQFVLTPALELPSSMAKKVDSENLGMRMTDK